MASIDIHSSSVEEETRQPGAEAGLTCPQCGSQCAPGGKFCVACGARLPALEATAARPINAGPFCDTCFAETTDESPGSVTTVNGIGTMLSATRWRKEVERCPRCHSVVQTKWLALFGIGLVPQGTYRIFYTKKGMPYFTADRYIGRRLINDPLRVATVGQQLGASPARQIAPSQTSVGAAATPDAGAATLAELGRRGGAFLVDYLFLTVINFIPVSLLSQLAERSGLRVDFMFFCLAYVVIPWIYFAAMESSLRQATWGKRILKIKVCDLAGQRISFGTATGRFFSKFLSAAPLGFGFLLPLFTENKQALHDRICSTLVVNVTTGNK